MNGYRKWNDNSTHVDQMLNNASRFTSSQLYIHKLHFQSPQALEITW